MIQPHIAREISKLAALFGVKVEHFYLYLRNHWVHCEEEDSPSLEVKETVDSNPWYLAPTGMIKLECQWEVSTAGPQIKTDKFYNC